MGLLLLFVPRFNQEALAEPWVLQQTPASGTHRCPSLGPHGGQRGLLCGRKGKDPLSFLNEVHRAEMFSLSAQLEEEAAGPGQGVTCAGAV